MVRNSKQGIMSSFCLILSILASFYSVRALANEQGFIRKGADADYFSNTFEAFNLSVLAQMLQNFYAELVNENEIFDRIIAIGDSLLLPLLGPLIIICTGSRLIQDLNSPGADVLQGLYATGGVVLTIMIYRFLMAELYSSADAIAQIIYPDGDVFEATMASLEDTVERFNSTKKNKDPVARLVDKTVSLYTEYFMAWGSKWGLMVLYGLFSYLRGCLFAINYVLGIFILPLFIIKNTSLPKNWVMITAFILLWGIMEKIMISVTGGLGTSALNASLDVDGVLPIFSESLFYVMLTTVNLLIAIGILSSVWIVNSYLLAPGTIAGAVSLFSLPAAALARMASVMGDRGATAVTGIGRSSVSARGRARERGNRGGSTGPYNPDNIFGSKRGDKSSRKRPDGGKAGDKVASSKESMPSPKRAYRMRSIIEHNGKLQRGQLPGNITAISRVGKKHNVKSSK